MPEQRARQYHRDRVSETLREEISAMLIGELADPRIAASTVTEVVMAPGGKSARVYLSVEGERDQEKSTIAALEKAKGFVRYVLKERMGVRHVPELTFHVDRSERVQARIDTLLGRATQNNARVAAQSSARAARNVATAERANAEHANAEPGTVSATDSLAQPARNGSAG